MHKYRAMIPLALAAFLLTALPAMAQRADDADRATTITFSADVEIGGQKLAAGTYALFTEPGENEWTIIFNKVAQQWGAFRHDAGQDAARVTATPKAIGEHVEEMEFVIVDSWVALQWEQLAVPFEVKKAG